MSRKNVMIALTVCVFALTAVAAQAEIVSLTLNNAGFETPAVGTQGALVAVSGVAQNDWTCYWDSTASEYFYQPQVIDSMHNTGWGYPMPVEGENIVSFRHKNVGGCVFSQQLTTDGSTAFHFSSGDVGGLLDMSIYASYRVQTAPKTSGTFQIELWDGAPDPNGTANLLGSSGVITVDAKPFALKSFVYTAKAADVGKDLWFAFRTYGPGYDDGLNMTFDNAAASFESVPEPSALALLATGLVGLLCYAWRKGK